MQTCLACKCKGAIIELSLCVKVHGSWHFINNADRTKGSSFHMWRSFSAVFGPVSGGAASSEGSDIRRHVSWLILLPEWFQVGPGTNQRNVALSCSGRAGIFRLWSERQQNESLLPGVWLGKNIQLSGRKHFHLDDNEENSLAKTACIYIFQTFLNPHWCVGFCTLFGPYSSNHITSKCLCFCAWNEMNVDMKHWLKALRYA